VLGNRIVPEPPVWSLFGVGLLGLLGAIRKRKTALRGGFVGRF
jgi:PEP-CTERM motif